MVKTVFLIFFLLACSAARADFEQDLSTTGNNPQVLRELYARATAGYADSQLNMGNLFIKGQVVEQDYVEAAKWYRLAARQGVALAQFNLGMIYDAGLGVAKNQIEAVRWYRAAAEQGLAIAQLNLGVAYADGEGGANNEIEAVRWFRLAAIQGEAQAQFNLGVLYAKGEGVAQDFIEAYRWSKLALGHGHETAKALLRDLTRQMSPEQLVAANKLIEAGLSREHVKSVANVPAFVHAVPAISEKSVPDTVIPLQDKSVVVQDNVPAVSDKIYVQLGAFRSEVLAEKFMTLLIAKLGDVGQPFSLFRKNNLVRIQVGPYQNTSEARLCADRLKALVGVEPMLQRY
jgi:cell division septation protein DedD